MQKEMDNPEYQEESALEVFLILGGLMSFFIGIGIVIGYLIWGSN